MTPPIAEPSGESRHTEEMARPLSAALHRFSFLSSALLVPVCPFGAGLLCVTTDVLPLLRLTLVARFFYPFLFTVAGICKGACPRASSMMLNPKSLP